MTATPPLNPAQRALISFALRGARPLTLDGIVTGTLVLGGAALAASIGGIGIVGSGIAMGVSSLELGALGAGAGYLADRQVKKAVRSSSTSSTKKAEPTTTPERRTPEQRVTDLRKHYEFLRDRDEPQDIQDLRRGDF